MTHALHTPAPDPADVPAPEPSQIPPPADPFPPPAQEPPMPPGTPDEIELPPRDLPGDQPASSGAR